MLSMINRLVDTILTKGVFFLDKKNKTVHIHVVCY